MTLFTKCTAVLTLRGGSPVLISVLAFSNPSLYYKPCSAVFFQHRIVHCINVLTSDKTSLREVWQKCFHDKNLRNLNMYTSSFEKMGSDFHLYSVHSVRILMESDQSLKKGTSSQFNLTIRWPHKNRTRPQTRCWAQETWRNILGRGGRRSLRTNATNIDIFDRYPTRKDFTDLKDIFWHFCNEVNSRKGRIGGGRRSFFS